MIYIRLFHGRTDPDQDMDDWGNDGPIFGPYKFAHTTYGHFLKLGKSEGHVDELFVRHEDLIYYDGVYYGDWSVFDGQVLKELQFQISVFQQDKAKLPENPNS
ncbi:MAG: hypothetical protein WC765_00610 [Phycisphaerae bacterium]